LFAAGPCRLTRVRWRSPRERKKPPGGGFGVHAVSHVHYGMMMIASAVRVGEITGDIQPVAGAHVNQAGHRP
jgi:hypothetical protein